MPDRRSYDATVSAQDGKVRTLITAPGGEPWIAELLQTPEKARETALALLQAAEVAERHAG